MRGKRENYGDTVEKEGERNPERGIRLSARLKEGKEGGSNKRDIGWDEWSSAATG